MGIPDHRFVVGWIGRMTGVKRTDVVLRGFRALRDEGVDAVLCMVGDGPDRKRVEELAVELGIVSTACSPATRRTSGRSSPPSTSSSCRRGTRGRR